MGIINKMKWNVFEQDESDSFNTLMSGERRLLKCGAKES